MPINSPAEPVWVANIRCPWGGESLYLSEEEAAEFNSDPDGHAAKHFGVAPRCRERLELVFIVVTAGGEQQRLPGATHVTPAGGGCG